MTTELVIANTALLPPGPRGWESADLPALYRRARKALEDCDRVDECADILKQAQAFASYYRMARDETLVNLALRIRLRAFRRCGEIFLKMDNNEGKRRIEAHAKASGLKPQHVHVAKQLAKLDGLEFERLVDGDPVPSVSALLGKALELEKRDWPREKKLALQAHHALGALSMISGVHNVKPTDLAEWLSQQPIACNRNMAQNDVTLIEFLIPWLDGLRQACEDVIEGAAATAATDEEAAEWQSQA